MNNAIVATSYIIVLGMAYLLGYTISENEKLNNMVDDLEREKKEFCKHCERYTD